VARIDRRVSPNQAALWTHYDLIDMQALRPAGPRPSPHFTRTKRQQTITGDHLRWPFAFAIDAAHEYCWQTLRNVGMWHHGIRRFRVRAPGALQVGTLVVLLVALVRA
jgi:hypothetical protein